MKKTLSVFLAALLILSVTVFSVSADDIESTAVEISASDLTRIEFDSNWEGLSGTDYTQDDDKTVVRSNGWMNPGAATRKINVAENGLYQVEHVTNSAISDISSHISRQTLDIDGLKFHDNLRVCNPSEVLTFEAGSMPNNYSGKYTETVALTAGEHTLTLETYGRTGTGMSNSAAYLIDYISFQKIGDIPKIPTSEGEAYHIEAEALAAANAVYYKETADAEEIKKGSYAGNYLNWVSANNLEDYTGTLLGRSGADTDGDKKLQYIDFSTIVEVETSGNYDFSYRGTLGAAYISAQEILVDGEVVLRDSTAEKESVQTVNTNFTLYDFKQTDVPLEKGIRTVTLRVYGATAQAGAVFYSDYMEIAPSKKDTPPTLPEGVAIRVEAENLLENVTTYHKATEDANEVLENQYSHGIAVQTKQDYYSNTAIGRAGGPWNNVDERFVAVALDTKVDVETEGWYSVRLCGTPSSSVISKQTVKVDGKEVVTTQSADRTFKATIDANFSLYEFQSDATFLSAGKHDLQLYIETCSQNAPVFFADYIDFATIDLPETVCDLSYDNKVTVHKYFDQILSGKFLIAAYKGKELIDATSTVLNNALEETITDWEIAERPDTIKVFTWDDNHAPLCDADVFTYEAANTDPFNGDNEINVVFLGDSLYQGAGATSESTKWVTLVGDYLKSTYEKDGVTVNWYNKGVGGTTTDYSLARIIRDCVDLNPDLVFYSATCNDGGRDTRVNMESAVRTLLSMENPPYIIMTRYTNKALSDSYGYVEEVAKHYGLPVIDDKSDLVSLMKEEGLSAESYFTGDGVHPNDKGYAHIAETVIRRLQSGLYYKSPTSPSKKLIDTSIAVTSAQYRTAQDASITRSDGWDTAGTYVTANKEGATLTFQFTGNFIAFDYGLHKDSGKIEVYIDNELKFTANPKYDDTLANYQLVGRQDSIFYDLENKEHTVVMKTVSQKEDKTLTDRIYGIFTGVCEK